jgi:hypothetical protein
MSKVGGGGSVSGGGKTSFGGGASSVKGGNCNTTATKNDAAKTTTLTKSCGIEGFKGKQGIDTSKFSADKLNKALVSNEAAKVSLPTPKVSIPTTPPTPKIKNPTKVPAISPYKPVNLDSFLDPKKASNAPFSKIIGAAEGNRTPKGGKTPHYYGHTDPGDKLWNIGSFSRANARFPGQKPAKTPQEADAKHLKSLEKDKEKYVNALKAKNLNPNNALLASTYFDAINQSVRAGNKMLAPQNLNYLAKNGISVKTVKEWRAGGYINLETNQRWLNSKGKPVGGGLANIANQNIQQKYKRNATESEILATIRKDQSRRIDAMVGTLEEMGLISGSQ